MKAMNDVGRATCPRGKGAKEAARREGAMRRSHTLRPLATATVRAARGNVVVGVRLDGASALGLRRGLELARVTASTLTVVHVISGHPRGAAPPGAWVRDLLSRRTRDLAARAAVQRWALAEVGVAIPEDALLVRFGDPAEQLAAAATALCARLLIVGGRPYATSARPAETTRRIVAQAECAVFVTGAGRAGATMVVATDMGNPSLPVLGAVHELAEQLDRRVSVVHNVDGVHVGGAFYPLPSGMHAHLCGTRLDRLSEVVRRDDRVDDARVMHEPDAASAILRAARTDDADVIVLGRRAAPGRTIGRVLADARRSVLVVPIPQRDALHGATQ